MSDVRLMEHHIQFDMFIYNLVKLVIQMPNICFSLSINEVSPKPLKILNFNIVYIFIIVWERLLGKLKENSAKSRTF